MSKKMIVAEPDIKKAVQEEILAHLEDLIDNEVSIMGDHYGVAEIAGEVLYQATEEYNRAMGELR